MKNVFCLIFSIILLVSCTEKITISREDLADKIKGGWAGQTFGCTYGGPTEFRYRGEMIPDDYVAPWDEDNRIKWYFDNNPGLYDDVYMDLSFLKVIDLYGMDASAEVFGEAFAHASYPLWHANQAARYNILNGIKPPESGYWKNNPHADDIDFQIEADFAGLVAPAMTDVAGALCDKVGHIMNYGDGYYGGLFVARMYSLAFIYDDVETVVGEALKAIPQESDFHKCIADVLEWHSQCDDWKEAWLRIEEKWSGETGCPEGVDAPFDIDAKINSAYVVMGLLYGGGDMERTMEISMRCGQDSDCNPATSAGILGTIMGYKAIPEKWTAPLEAVSGRKFAHTDVSFNNACEMSERIALQNIKENGGKVTDAYVRIPVRYSDVVPFEKSFDCFSKVEKESGGCGRFTDSLSLAFEGRGVVLTGWLDGTPEKLPEGFARLSVTVDGGTPEVFILPCDFAKRRYDLYWNYNLPEGAHKITLSLLDRADGVSVKCTSKVIYN
ncbi:MAG: ADP-ribosylglycohydrolase family protein [Bacteroidales bacterium]|nr:ADP-ribosylglycohydrolase family protein [Bacteroidales bacterium]